MLDCFEAIRQIPRYQERRSEFKKNKEMVITHYRKYLKRKLKKGDEEVSELHGGWVASFNAGDPAPYIPDFVHGPHVAVEVVHDEEDEDEDVPSLQTVLAWM